jgi:tRNA/rRNA methyltransferase
MIEADDLLSRLRIVLVAPSHPGNIGAAARAMATMGLSRLVLVAPKRFPDPEADAMAAGAATLLESAHVVATLDEAISGAALAIGLSGRPREFAGRVLAVRDAAAEAIANASHGDIAIVLGTEMSGLSNADLERCAIVASIPASADYPSLNLAAAVQVVAYELRVAATGGAVWRAPRFAPATADEIEALYANGERTLVAMRILNPEMPKRLISRLRRLFARAGLEKEEVNILRGILARIDQFIAKAPVVEVPAAEAQSGEAPAPMAHCRNCGTPAPGAYCPACGQETRTRPPTFLQFMREAGGRYVALDGRLWRTLGGLLFRPGFLTREYFLGRRRRYIRPARLFLVASLMLFAALRIVVELGDFEVVHVDPAAKSETKAAAKPAAPASEDKSDHALSIDDDFNVAMFDLQFPTIKKRVERFNRMSTQEKAAQMTDGVLRYGPYAMFVLLPAFALLLKVVYLGGRRRHPYRPRLYSEHMVFAAHNHAFLFVAIIAAQAFVGVLRGAMIVWMLVYMLWSMRVVYRGSWLGIGLRSFALFIAYSVLFGLVTAGLLAVAVLLR